MLKRVVLLVLLLAVFLTLFSFAEGKDAKASVAKKRRARRAGKKSRKAGKKGRKARRGGKRRAGKKSWIKRLKDGRIVKRFIRSGAVLQKVCKIVRKVGRKITVCCKGVARTVRKGKNVHCRKVRICKKQVNKCVKKGRKNGICKRRRITCKKHKVSLQCFIKLPKRHLKWRGPKKCKAGFTLDVKRKGKFLAIRYCKGVPTAAPATTGPKGTPRDGPQPIPKPEPEVRCIASGDPHYTAFDNKYSDFYQTGDFLLAESADKLVSVHTRQQLTNTWRTNAVNKAVGVLVNGKDKFVYKGETNSFIINGKKVDLAVGQSVNFEDGGSVKRTGNRNFEVKCIHNIRVSGDVGGTPGTDPKASFYINVFVFAPKDVAAGITGHCGQGKNHKRSNVSGIFNHIQFPEFLKVKIPKASPRQLKVANKFCAVARSKNTRHSCVTDYLLGGKAGAKANLGVERRAQKIEARIQKKRKSWIKRAIRRL